MSKPTGGGAGGRDGPAPGLPDEAAALRAAEARFAALAASVSEVVVRFDPARRCLYASPSLEQLSGRPTAALVGKTCSEAGMPEELAVLCDAALRRVFATGHPQHLELALPSREGIRLFECRLLAESAGAGAAVTAALAVAWEVAARGQARASQARLQVLARRLVEAQERERRHIARELHDEAGQALASLRFGLGLLEREHGEGGAVTARVAELVRTTDAVIDGLHRLAADLRPASLDHLGLDAALRQYTRSTAAAYGLDVRFKSRGGGARLPPAVETALFRVVQEAVTNVVRHARANRVDVLMEHRGDRVLMMVEDDGVGFDPERAQAGEHFGLLGLRERAEALGGTLTVESAPGAGTTVVVEVASADPDPDR